jgi:hypothetical protein
VNWNLDIRLDFIAVWSYLLAVIPFGARALLDLGWNGKQKSPEEKMKLHFIWLTVFLILAHVAMIFGMIDPEIIGQGSGGKM